MLKKTSDISPSAKETSDIIPYIYIYKMIYYITEYGDFEGEPAAFQLRGRRID